MEERFKRNQYVKKGKHQFARVEKTRKLANENISH